MTGEVHWLLALVVALVEVVDCNIIIFTSLQIIFVSKQVVCPAREKF